MFYKYIGNNVNITYLRRHLKHVENIFAIDNMVRSKYYDSQPTVNLMLYLCVQSKSAVDWVHRTFWHNAIIVQGCCQGVISVLCFYERVDQNSFRNESKYIMHARYKEPITILCWPLISSFCVSLKYRMKICFLNIEVPRNFRDTMIK